MRCPVLTRAALSCALSLAPMLAQAQLAELRPGVRVRIRAPATVAGLLTATVVRSTADSVSFAASNAVVTTVPTAGLTSVEISRGKSHGKGAVRGLMWGVGVGAGLGLLVVLPKGYCEETYGTGSSCSKGQDFADIMLGSLVVGSAVGAVIGRERWERLSLPARLSVVPKGRSLGLQVGLRF